MSLAKQVSLLAAGCQPWNSDVCAANGDRFAYCATLAIYIYQFDYQYKEFRLHCIISEHKKTITTIAWSSRSADLLASASCDNQVIIYNIASQKVIAKLENTQQAPTSIGWCPHEKDCISFTFGKGPLFVWNHSAPGHGLSQHKEAQNFQSNICQFRWHPKKMGKVIFGHMDGSISYHCPGQKNQRHIFRPDDLESAEVEDPVVALEWDPLSIEYLLMVNTYHGIRLIDTESITVISKFQLPSVAAQVHTLAWIHTAPGMFLTGDTHTGVLRVWSVSKMTPVESLKLKKKGFHALHVVTATVQSEVGVPGLSSANSPSAVPGSYALPPGHALCTFQDGGVGLYDLGRRKWNFLRDQGHVETIFDCRFHPDDPDILATASFDGTIKVWDVNTMTPINTSPGNEGVIYCLSWAPADLNCIAASTSRKGVFIWDIKKNKVIKRLNEHGKVPVYSVAWNSKDSRLIASCGGDCYCIIRQVDGSPHIKYKHPGVVFGCDWSPLNKDMIATGCEDKNVRVYYMATNSEQPLKTFSGHTGKVFHVRWSPLRDGVLCSGSDDGTIRLWDYTQDGCMMLLAGHSAPVRGLLWNPEIPYLLVSGSWDSTIRVWDARDGACVDTILDHGADVYGLTTHPNRPFVMASCSRDSTLRLWSLTSLVQPLEMNILVERPWNEIIVALAEKQTAMELGTPPLLAGKISKDIKVKIDRLQEDVLNKSLRWFSKFFASPGGTDNLWELVTVVMGLDDSLLSGSYSKGIMHCKHVTRFKTADAQQLEMARASRSGLGGSNREDRLQETAKLHIKLGNIQRYCEIMVELGEWEKALAVAPGVSMKYWKALAERRAKHLVAEDSDEVVPVCVATANMDLLVEFFTNRGQLQDAMLAAAALHEGNIQQPRLNYQKGPTNGPDESDDGMRLLQRTTAQLAEWHFLNGAPVLAACCHLAVDDTQKAMQKLIRGNNLELAASIGQVIGGEVAELTHLALELLARRCEKIGRWDLAIELLKKIPDNEMLLAKLCARCAASMVEINDLHQKAGFPSMDDCSKKAEKLHGNGKVLGSVQYYLMSNQPEVGLKIGLDQVKDIMSSNGWTASQVFDLLQLLAAVQTEKLQQHKCMSERNALLVLCAYVGMLVAVRKKYDSIVLALFTHILKLLERDKPEVPLSVSLVTAEMEAWKAHVAVSGKMRSSPSGDDREIMTSEQQTIFENILAKAGEEKGPAGIGHDVIGGSNLPSHSDVHASCLTGQRIQGPAFFLEDGRSALSVSDALMWAKVNPFSPTGSGVRINPF